MKFPILAAAIVVALSGAALAEDTNSHAAHHPDQTPSADQGTTQNPVPVVKPSDQTPATMNMNCPMMGTAQTNMMTGTQPPPSNPTIRQHMVGGKLVPMAGDATNNAGTTNCPMMQQHPAHTMTLHHDSTP